MSQTNPQTATAPTSRRSHARQENGSLCPAGRWCTAHWLALVNIALSLALIGAVLAPALHALGLDAAAGAIHTLYLLLCPQRPEHSYFLFGYQLAFEHREIAMLASLLVAGLAFRTFGDRPRRIGLPLVLLSSLPLVLDVFSQTLELRESDWFTRTWTAALFCAVYVFWLYPGLDLLLRRREPGSG